MMRVYKVGREKPDPYAWHISCRFASAEKVEAVANNEDPPTPEQWNAVLRTLGTMEVEEVFYTRYKDGKERIHRRKTRKE